MGTFLYFLQDFCWENIQAEVNYAEKGRSEALEHCMIDENSVSQYSSDTALLVDGSFLGHYVVPG